MVRARRRQERGGRRAAITLAAWTAVLVPAAAHSGATAAAVRGSPADAPPTASVPDVERAAIAAAIGAIDACLERLDPAVHRGYARVARACPEVAARLADPALRVRLAGPPDAAGSAYGVATLVATRDSFAALVAMADGPRAPAPGRAGTRVDPPALRELAASLAGNHGPGTRMDWLRRGFGLDAEPTPAGGAVAGGLEPAAVRSQRIATTAGLLGVVALLALAGLAAWRVTSAIRRGRRPTRAVGRRGGAEDAPASAVAAWPCTGARHADAQAAQLLEEVAARLRRAQPRLTTDHLTARELLTHAGAMPALADLADVAERLRFAAQPPGERAVDAALVSARRQLGLPTGAAS